MVPRLNSLTIKEPGRQYYCWMSGMTESVRPEKWHAPWKLQIAHIGSGGGRSMRVDDRRAVVLLCPLVHDLHVSDSDRLPAKTIMGIEYPTIDERHTLWLKREMDPKYWDLDFIRKYWIGEPPEPTRPPEYWCREYFNRTGVMR